MLRFYLSTDYELISCSNNLPLLLLSDCPTRNSLIMIELRCSLGGSNCLSGLRHCDHRKYSQGCSVVQRVGAGTFNSLVTIGGKADIKVSWVEPAEHSNPLRA